MEVIKYQSFDLKMPLAILPVRSSCIATADGRRVLVNPGSGLSDDELKSFGQVTDIAATNLFHGAGMKRAVKVFPQARVWGVKGLAKAKPNIPWTDILSEATWPYKESIEILEIQGMPKVNEVVLLHKDSKTLFVADLVFNLRGVDSLGGKIIYGLFGTINRFAVSRLFLLMVKNKGLFQNSIDKLKLLDFNQIVMSHGEIITENAKTHLLSALAERKL